MRNLTEINSKLKYETYIHNLNIIISRYSFVYSCKDLDNLFFTDFIFYINRIIYMLVTTGFDQSFTNNQVLKLSKFLYDNKQYIDFELIKSGSLPYKNFFKKYFSRYIHIDKEIFIIS